MFNKERLERLEKRIEYLEDKETKLKNELKDKKIVGRRQLNYLDVDYKAISLEELEKTQQRILKYLNVELKTTPEKTDLVNKEKR